MSFVKNLKGRVEFRNAPQVSDPYNRMRDLDVEPAQVEKMALHVAMEMSGRTHFPFGTKQPTAIDTASVSGAECPLNVS